MMVDEQQDTPPPIPDDGLDDDALVPKLPFFWFGLMAIPVVMGLLASIFSPETPETADPATQAQIVAEQPQTAPGREQIRRWDDLTNGNRSGGRSKHNSQSRKPVLGTTCNFKDYVGRPYSTTIKTELELTKRKVLWFKDVGQQTPIQDPTRINIYLNTQKTITRIECG